MKNSIKMALLATVAFTAVPAIAGAGDFPVKATSTVPSASWTGFYMGGSLGGANQRTTADITGPQFWDTAYSTAPISKASKFGGLLGGQIGYNWQIRNFVLGIEGDANYLFGMKKSVSSTWQDCSLSSCAPVIDTNTTGFASVRGRFGYDLMQGTLIYGTAGIGWIKLNHNMNVTGANGKNGNFSASVWQPAFVFGGGIEQMIDRHWSIRSEVLWAKADTYDASPTDLHYFDGTTPPVHYETSLTMVRVGVNYKY